MYSGSGHDYLTGGIANDLLAGRSGNDTYKVQEFLNGADTIDDSVGVNTLDVSLMNVGVTVDLARTNMQSLYPGYLSLKFTSINTISNFEGTSGNDTILGNSLNNEIRGEGGHDVIEGRAGNDRYVGGPGSDRFVFSGLQLVLLS